jgi:glycine dehydrogenase
MKPLSLTTLEKQRSYAARHMGQSADERQTMLATLGLPSLEALLNETLPPEIQGSSDLDLPGCPNPLSEQEALQRLFTTAQANNTDKPLIGLGYYGTITPSVIARNLLHNAGWTTAYTPYQAEIAQGRLEALMNFQQMVIDLTGLPIANASLLDEATAAAEAMSMMRRLSARPVSQFFVDADSFPQTQEVLKTRAHYLGITLIVAPASQAADFADDLFGALLQTPNQRGECQDYTQTITKLHESGVLCAIACDPLAQVILKSPGAMGADIALGSSQRFGTPMGAGGPHAAFFSCQEKALRQMPGRLIGWSKDRRGRRALRLSLQTREQHIRREKATSNICTAQALLAVAASMYAVYHGSQGLNAIAQRVHRLTGILVEGLRDAGIPIHTQAFFDTIHAETSVKTPGFLLRQVAPGIQGISLDETVTRDDLSALLFALTGTRPDIDALDQRAAAHSPLSALHRDDPILTHPVFHSAHREHEMLRYLRHLQGKDLSLDHAMIPLGSCTMKLNAASALIPMGWSQWNQPHPFAPPETLAGTKAMVDELSTWLAAITGLSTVSMQPNSGAQGEYAGLLAIRRYYAARGQAQRHICLIPRSAHGTNPASAHLCGLNVITLGCDAQGNIDRTDLAQKLTAHADHICCLMLTTPSTHGVFEPGLPSLCRAVHDAGGQVYMDGANLNAWVGMTTPADCGVDVCHINLHKTFAIPHGGGGPGMGPIALAPHLAPYAPGHFTQNTDSAVSAAPYGSASILPIAWMYMAMLGAQGLHQASAQAILNANYIATRLKDVFPVLYTGGTGRVAHECIIDIRPIKTRTGISEIDIAKRLMDYSFHAPTVSFPVPGTLMIEPTESESLAELDRFCAAMIAIAQEIDRVEQGLWPRDDHPLKNAPHTIADLADEDWPHPYSREQAAYPLPYLRERKFWPCVNRIDEVFGDRHLCSNCSGAPAA